MEESECLFATMLELAETQNSEQNVKESEKNKEHLLRIQRIYDFQVKQKSDLIELRNCIEFINQHTHVIQSALREAGESNAAVPVCGNIVKDIIAVKTNIQESINNALEIKEMVGANYEPFMENLLRKMEVQLNNWSSALNVASRTLVNSSALVDNIQNLIVAQQQMCSEVVASDLFLCLDTESSTPPQGAPQHDTINSEQFNESGKCSTPIQFKEN